MVVWKDMFLHPEYMLLHPEHECLRLLHPECQTFSIHDKLNKSGQISCFKWALTS